MADLTLDLKLLEQLKDDLNAVVKEFTNADGFSDDVADATGQDQLHGPSASIPARTTSSAS